MAKDSLTKLRKITMEPKVYAIVVKSIHGQIIHLGVHYSLDEAYTLARRRLEALAPHTDGDAIDIDLWHCISGSDALALLTQTGTVVDHVQSSLPLGIEPVVIGSFPSAAIEEILQTIIHETTKQDPRVVTLVPKKAKNSGNDRLQTIKDRKNELMKKLIDKGDIKAVEKAKDVFTKHEIKFITDQIEKRDTTGGLQK